MIQTPSSNNFAKNQPGLLVGGQKIPLKYIDGNGATNGQLISFNTSDGQAEWITASGTGNILSINADVTAAQLISAGAGISVNTVGGNTTITNTALGGGGLSVYGNFYQTVADVGATIAADNGKALFHAAGADNTSGFTMIADSGDITINVSGVYEVNWEITCAEPGAMSLYVGAGKVTGTCFGTGAGTQNITGTAILSLTATDVVSLRSDNCPGALTLQLAGTTNTAMIVASISLKKLN